MVKLVLVAALLIAYMAAPAISGTTTRQTTTSSTTWNPTTSTTPYSTESMPTTDEDRIKHFIQTAKIRCSRCQLEAQSVLSSYYKNDICNYVNNYGSCSLVNCYGNEYVNSLYVQAQDLCDTNTYSYAGTDVIRASMIAVLATAVLARFLL